MAPAPVKIVLSREAARYIRAGTPREARLKAANGELALEVPEWITVLFLLSQDPDDEIQTTALERLRGIPADKIHKALEHGLAPPVLDLLARERRDEEDVLLEIAAQSETSDETMAFLASLPKKQIIEAVSKDSMRVLRSPEILEALGTNPISSRGMVDKLLFLFGVGQKTEHGPATAEGQGGKDGAAEEAADGGDAPEGAEAAEAAEAAAVLAASAGDLPDELLEEVEAAANEHKFDQHNLMSMVKMLTVFQKIKLALLGNREARGILVRDRNKVVATATVQNPKLTETEVIGFSKSKDVCDEVLRLIARNRDWTKVYQVQLGLASNPKTPLVFAMKFLAYVKERDLRNLAKSKDILPQVNAQARRLLNQKKGDG
ncbi:MAG: hypothetical protein ACE5FC_05930 [Myxococcota bacterium]